MFYSALKITHIKYYVKKRDSCVTEMKQSLITKLETFVISISPVDCVLGIPKNAELTLSLLSFPS